MYICQPQCYDYFLGKSDPSKGIYGTGAHSDYGMITLLATDGVMGLQVMICALKKN